MAKRRGRPKGRKPAGFNPETLITLVDVTPKIAIRAKRLSLNDARRFHAHLGRLLAELEGKKK